jgi:uncharacterized OB-fold protein
VSGRGTVFSYTVNHQPFNAAVPVPYVIAIVRLDEQDDLRIATNIVGCEPDSVRVGMPVQVCFECHDNDGEAVYVPIFTPQPEAAEHHTHEGNRVGSPGIDNSTYTL